ncbi:MAG: hypothetical protein ACRYFX_10720 [Janthinobacterium lividum]
MKNYLLLAGLFLSAAGAATAQTTTPAPTLAGVPTSPRNHGSIYLTWQYNRDWYTKSDIRFRNDKSDDYDFVFHDAVAHDHPTMSEFWKLQSLTVPQYDLSVGYLFHDKHDLGIEVAWNHLKYVVDDDQVMRVSGEIRGRHLDRDTLVTPDFVHLQHTNGNNYLMVNLVKRWQLKAGRHVAFSAIGKVGGGPMISYTISTIFGSHAEGPFHFEGVVAGVSGGLHLDLYRYFFLQTDLQGAWADYTNSYIGADRQGRVTHHFGSAQWSYGFGFNVPL